MLSNDQWKILIWVLVLVLDMKVLDVLKYFFKICCACTRYIFRVLDVLEYLVNCTWPQPWFLHVCTLYVLIIFSLHMSRNSGLFYRYTFFSQRVWGGLLIERFLVLLIRRYPWELWAWPWTIRWCSLSWS